MQPSALVGHVHYLSKLTQAETVQVKGLLPLASKMLPPVSIPSHYSFNFILVIFLCEIYTASIYRLQVLAPTSVLLYIALVYSDS